MRSSRTNLAVVVLMLVAAASGLVAFSLGTPIAALPVTVHGLAGTALLVLAPWKVMAAYRGLRGRADGRRWRLSLLLAVATTVALVSGFLQASGAVPRLGSLTMMQVHVGSALLAVVLTPAHLRGRPMNVALAGRREFLRAGGLFGLAGLAWLGFEGALRSVGLPGGQRRFTGSHERGSFDAAALPATQWLDDRPPEVAEGHRVRFDATGEERNLSIEDLDRGDRLVATLDCTSGWYSTQEWEGALLANLIPPGVEGSILVTSLTGYRRRFPVSDAHRLLLATRLGGEPLRSSHGAPVRLVAPGRRGFWWVKWVAAVEIDGRPAWWQLPFPMT